MSLLDALSAWAKLVADGADPIEAMHGHVCSPACWHRQGLEHQRDERGVVSPSDSRSSPAARQEDDE